MLDTHFTSLRNNAATWFDRVEAGETVRVLRHGKPIAEIRPVSTGKPSWQRPAQPLAISGTEISRVILEDRNR